MIEVIRVLRYTFESREGYNAHRRNWQDNFHSPGLGMIMDTLSVTTAEHPNLNAIEKMPVPGSHVHNPDFPDVDPRTGDEAETL